VKDLRIESGVNESCDIETGVRESVTVEKRINERFDHLSFGVITQIFPSILVCILVTN